MDPSLVLGSVAVLKDDYLADIQAEIDKEPEKPKKKTKAQKRAERKERRRLEAIEDRKLVMRDQLQRELVLSKRMEHRGMQEWEDMCRKIKMTELREELCGWSEHANRNFERKNDKIEFLLDEMDDTQEQQQKLNRKTIEVLEYISSCYSELLKSIKNIYNMQAEDLLKDYYAEMKRRSEEVEYMHENSENIIHASNFVAIDTLKEDYQIYLERRDDCVNTEIENRFVIRNQVVSKMGRMQRNLNDFVDTLRNTELDTYKYERIRWLTERQLAFVEESKKLNLEEIKHTALIAEVHREMVALEGDSSNRINDLKLELGYFQNVRQKIERDLHLDRQITHEKLRILTTESYNVMKDLDKYAKMGELLLSLSANCRKLQTQSEKVVLGGEITDPIELEEVNVDFKLKTLDLKKHLDITEEELAEQHNLMRNFWRRQAIVEAQNLLLLEDKKELTAENNSYINFIKSMSVTNDVKDLEALLKVTGCQDQPMPAEPPCAKYKVKRGSSFSQGK